MSTKVPSRVVLTHKGVTRKFFTLYQGKDRSIYIHPYRQAGHPWKIPGDHKNDSMMCLDFENYKTPNFDLNKISFHPTGFIHLTDKKGDRYKDGTKGPMFKEMEYPYLLCVLVPCNLENLPVFNGDKKSAVYEIDLPDDITPFYFNLSLYKDEKIEVDPTNFLTFGVKLNDEYNLKFILRHVNASNENIKPSWPEFPFFLLRIGA